MIKGILPIAVETSAEVIGRSVGDICGTSQDRDVVEARCFATAVCMERGIQGREIAEYLNKSDGSIHHYKVLHRNMMETNTKYKVDFSTFTALFISNLGRANQQTWLDFQKELQDLFRRFPNQVELIHALYHFTQKEKE